MSALEIVIIVVSVVFVMAVFANSVYRKIKHKPSGECCSCAKRGERLVKEYHRKYKSEK